MSSHRGLFDPPVDTYPVQACELAVGDGVWIGYPTMQALAGVVTAIEPARRDDYRVVVSPDDVDLPTEPRLIANDYPGLYRFYRRGQFTDADTAAPVCVLLGEVDVAAGIVSVDTGIEAIEVGAATEGLLETLEFLSAPRSMGDVERFSQGRGAIADLPDRILAKWQPATVERSGSQKTSESAEGATIRQFRRVGARLAPGAQIVTDQAKSKLWLAANPDRPHHVQPVGGLLHGYLTDASTPRLSLYDFVADLARVHNSSVGPHARELLFDLNSVVGNGVALVAVPRRRRLHRIFDFLADLGF